MSAWPDVMVLERPGPGLPIEAVDPTIGEVDPLDLTVHPDRVQRYALVGVLLPALDAMQSALDDLRAKVDPSGGRADARK